MGERGLARVDEFSVERMVADLDAFYAEVTAGLLVRRRIASEHEPEQGERQHQASACCGQRYGPLATTITTAAAPLWCQQGGAPATRRADQPRALSRKAA